MKQHLQLKFNRLNKVFSNAGMWFMLMLDVIFICVLIGHGYSLIVLAFTIAIFVAEGLLVLSKLPKPIINLKANANIIFLIVFAPMPILAIVWGNMLGDVYLVFFALLGAGRFATYLLSFIFSLLPRVSVMFSGLGIVAFLVTLAIVIFGLVSGNVNFTLRPATYTVVTTTTGEKVVALKKVYNGFNSNVNINTSYLGTVKVIATKAIPQNVKIGKLTIGSKVTQIQSGAIKSAHIKDLVIVADNVNLATDSINLYGSTNIVFAGENAVFKTFAIRTSANSKIDIRYSTTLKLDASSFQLKEGTTVNFNGAYPEANYSFIQSESPKNIKLNFAKSIIDNAVQDKNLQEYSSVIAPITNKDEYYVRFVSDYYGISGHGKGEYIPIKYYSAEKGLELPKLEIKGYKFVSWFNSDTYSQKITGTNYKDNTIAYAKTLKIYTIGYNLSGGKLASGDFITERTIEVGDVELPLLKKDGYAFNGWYYEDDTYFYNAVKTVKKGTESNCLFVASFSKNYNIKLVTQGATLSYNIPSVVTNKTDRITLPEAKKQGYTFKGWYINADFSDKTPVLAINPQYLDEDVTLYAKFVEELNKK